MDIRQLRYFITIVECGSFTRAAAKLRIAQPALSQHVLAMEARLGVTLLQRNPRGVLPTEAGLRLLERANEIDRNFSSLEDYVAGATIPAGQVRFGMPATINEQLGVPLIEAGQLRFPNVRIRISEAMSGFVLGWLREGTIDLALLYNVTDEKGLTLHHALTEEIMLFAAPGMAGAPAGGHITLTAALRLPLILPSSGHGLRDLIEVAAQSIGKPLAPKIEIDSYRQIKALTTRGIGFGMLPTTAVQRDVAAGTLRAWKVTRPTLERRIFLGHPSHRPLANAAQAIGRLSWEILQSRVQDGGWIAQWADATPLSLYALQRS